MPEIYLVSDVTVELYHLKGTLTRGDIVKNVEGVTRQSFLAKVGDVLQEDFKLETSAIWGLYNVVSLR